MRQVDFDTSKRTILEIDLWSRLVNLQQHHALHPARFVKDLECRIEPAVADSRQRLLYIERDFPRPAFDSVWLLTRREERAENDERQSKGRGGEAGQWSDGDGWTGCARCRKGGSAGRFWRIRGVVVISGCFRINIHWCINTRLLIGQASTSLSSFDYNNIANRIANCTFFHSFTFGADKPLPNGVIHRPDNLLCPQDLPLSVRTFPRSLPVHSKLPAPLICKTIPARHISRRRVPQGMETEDMFEVPSCLWEIRQQAKDTNQSKLVGCQLRGKTYWRIGVTSIDGTLFEIVC